MAGVLVATFPGLAAADHPEGGKCKHQHGIPNDALSASVCAPGKTGKACKKTVSGSKRKGACVQLSRSCDCLTDQERVAILLIGGMAQATRAGARFDAVAAVVGSTAACFQLQKLVAQLVFDQGVLLTMLGFGPFGFYDPGALDDLDLIMGKVPVLASQATGCSFSFNSSLFLSQMLSIKGGILANGL
jgi:hypothetical protein